MNAGCAKNIAIEWVRQRGSQENDFLGAYFSGSIIAMPDGAELAASSDVDIVVVSARELPRPKLGKFLYRGALLEVTTLPWRELADVEEVLASHHLAHSLSKGTIIADPTGRIHRLQAQVALHFAEYTWVRRRCEHVLHKIEDGLQRIDAAAPFHDQVTGWLFPTGITTHVILLAALGNPTVRRRYLAARHVLEQYGHSDFYTSLLDWLGCAHLAASRIEGHLDALARAFDAAAAVARTPFSFSSDITAIARPIAIDGSRAMIAAGDHREAVFWMVATFSRCLKILAADAPTEMARAHAPAFEAMMADLGITCPQDITHRAQEVKQFLPRLWAVAEEIMSKNSAIAHDWKGGPTWRSPA